MSSQGQVSSTVVQNPKYCTVYIQKAEQWTFQQIQKQLETGKINEKIEAIKNLIINIIHDDSFPRMTMQIITNILPIQSESHALKKVLLLYWEIIEKEDQNGNLKDEMYLVNNSLRNDLLHPNEYIRGRTLRLLMRVMHKGVLEPLSSAILENLTFKHSYVRRNALSLLYMIYLNFQNDVIPDIDEHVEKVLLSESDLSTKRNAFLLLYNTNQQKAIDYITENIIDDVVEESETGDLVQLVVLELLRKTCKIDPSHKPKLIKAIQSFSNSKSSSVLFECASTLVQISQSVPAIKMSINIYIQLLSSNTDNNVKLIVLEKINQLKKISQQYLEEQIVEITNTLNNSSLDIRRKTLDLIKNLVNNQNIQLVTSQMFKQLQKIVHSTEESDIEFRMNMLQTLEIFSKKFPQIAEESLQIICDQLLTYSELDYKSSKQIMHFLRAQLEKNEILKGKILEILIKRFPEINSENLIKSTLWLIAQYTLQEHAADAINQIKRAIGTLPIEPSKTQQKTVNKDEEETKQPTTQKQTKYRTIILPDGTYGTEIVDESDKQRQEEIQQETYHSELRQFLIQNPYFSSILVTTLLKLLNKIKSNKQQFNKFGSEILLILCSIIKLYVNQKQNQVDLNVREKIMLGIKMITNQQFYEQQYPWLEKNDFDFDENDANQAYFEEELTKQFAEKAKDAEDQIQMQRQPDDLIVIRQLKGKNTVQDVDLFDDEVDLQLGQDSQQDDFTHKLQKIVQLTGYSDPIYAEAFVKIHKYDISFEILLINRTDKPMQNVSIEFSTQGDLKVLEKPQSTSLAANQSIQIKTSIKLSSSSEAGLIFTSLTYENRAGITQCYMITNEIYIDIIDFIYPANIQIEDFRERWTRYEWENRILINTNFENPYDYIKHIQSQLKMHLLTIIDSSENNKFLSVNLYAQTKLDDDFLMNISIETNKNKINGYIRIRSKTKGIVMNLGERIKKIQLK